MANITQHIMTLISYFNGKQTFLHINPVEINQTEVKILVFSDNIGGTTLEWPNDTLECGTPIFTSNGQFWLILLVLSIL